jgi:O-antigen ligase
MVIFGWMLMALVAWGALAFGSVYAWAYWPLAIVSAGMGVWAWVATRGWRDHTVNRLAVCLAGVAIAIGLQTIVMPYRVVTWLSPGIDQFFRRYMIAYRPPAVHSLSLQPSRTLVVLLLFVAFGLLFLGTVRAIKRLRLDWFVSQFMGLGMAMALLGIVQFAFLNKDAPLLYGFWRPGYGAAPFGPFINKNHFAGWMVMVLPVVVAYGCAVFLATPRPYGAHRRLWLRWLVTVEANRFLLVVVASLVMALSVVLTGSRSGIASLMAAFACLGIAVWRELPAGRPRWMTVGAMTFLIVAALAWGGADTLVARFNRAPDEFEGRLAAWRDASMMVRDFPWFGIGLGSFERAMLVYQTVDRSSIYAQTHNDYLQLVTEGGALVIAPTVVTVAMMLGILRRRLQPGQEPPLHAWVRVGAVAGLVGILTQSLVEFSLQMPGNTVLFAILLAIALHRPRESRPYANRV